MPEWLDDVDGGVEIRLRVVTGAAKTAIAGPYGDALRVRVAAVPEKGRANTALIDYLQGLLRPALVEMVAGAGGRSKRLRVTGLEAAEVERRLCN